MANGMKQGGSGSSEQLPDATIPPLKRSGGGTSTIATGPAVSPRPRTMGGVATTAPITPSTGTTTGSSATAAKILQDLQRMNAEQQNDDAQDQVLMDYLNRSTTRPEGEDPMKFKVGGTAKKEDKGIPDK